MFKKLKDKIEEEFKQAPLKFPVSVQQLAQVISPSPSVNSLSDSNTSASLTYPTEIPHAPSDLFSIGGDDDSQDGVIKAQMTLQNVDLTATSPSNMTHGTSRSRRSSLSSVTSEASSLFPIYESGLAQSFFQSDFESEMEDGLSGQIEKISKEQLYQSFKKVLNRYNKYKGRYTELLKHFKELQHDNFKTKNVLQESQDKALRRIAELREQCQLEQKAKAHLEESLRNDVEERDHVINTLKTKISLLSPGEDNVKLIDIEKNQDLQSDTISQSRVLSELKSQNEDLQKEVERLKRIKETACHLIHRCDTTINEATEDVKSDNLKQKMSELKTEIQKMKSENESLSHLLARNILTEDDKKLHTSSDNGLMTDLSVLETSQADLNMDEKDKKIEKLNNLLLKCKEKINGLNAEIKAKNLIIENNGKKIKELKDEMEAAKMREEENALTVAENKKAIHKELDAKEEQIKALTKELKTKENEFIKEKEETVNCYETKIRDMKTDFINEMKSKMDQNQKLMEDLKAKEIVSGSLEKLKNAEENFAGILEFVKNRSSAFEEFAKCKTTEIEKAHRRLEEKVAATRKNLIELLQSKQLHREVESERGRIEGEKVLEKGPGGNRGGAEVEAENSQVVEKLKSDVMNLSKKIEILEVELEGARKQSKIEKEEGSRWKERCEGVESERDRLNKEIQEKLNENTELGKALTNRNEEIKKVENEKEMLRNASKEKIETESKLKEYVEKYNKLEKENRTLQNDLMEKCGKLLKDLNDSKERVKNLEEDGKAKSKELESVKKKHAAEDKQKSKEIEEMKKEWLALKTDANVSQQKVLDELKKLKSESDEMRMAAAAECSDVKSQLRHKEDELNRMKKNLEEWETRKTDLQQMEIIKKERMQEKELCDRLKNELEALRGNLKSELKEKEEKSILVDKLTQECNLLMAEIENLKKVHSNAERKLEMELQAARNEATEHKNIIDKLQENLEDGKNENESKANEIEEIKKGFEDLSLEHERLKLEHSQRLALLNESTTENDRIKSELAESEKIRKDLGEKIFKLTNEMNEAFGVVQLKQNELETHKDRLKSLTEELVIKQKTFEEEKLRLASESENKLNVLKNEIKFINLKHEEDIGNIEDSLNFEMKEATEKIANAEKTSVELLGKLERITSERDRLKAAEVEKNIKISELEGCMKALKMELDDKFNDAKEEEITGRKHKEEIKEIIMRYDKEVAERDEEIEALKSKLSEIEDLEDAQERHRNEIREIIIQYDSEIAKRDDEIESLKLKQTDSAVVHDKLKTAREKSQSANSEPPEKENLVQNINRGPKNPSTDEVGNKMAETMTENSSMLNSVELDKKLTIQKIELEKIIEKEKREKTELMEKLRIEKDRALNDEKEKWKKKFEELKQKYEREGIEFHDTSKRDEKATVKTVEKKNGEDMETNCASKVTVAALESKNPTSVDLLQNQLIQQASEMKELKKQYKKEIMELRKIGSSKKRSRKNSLSDNQEWYLGGVLDNDTEHEYLRNILYEYMMGKEQLVLAKVLSAIVKFNEEQTHNVLEKEQQRQTLLGQLGLL